MQKTLASACCHCWSMVFHREWIQHQGKATSNVKNMLTGRVPGILPTTHSRPVHSPKRRRSSTSHTTHGHIHKKYISLGSVNMDNNTGNMDNTRTWTLSMCSSTKPADGRENARSNWREYYLSTSIKTRFTSTRKKKRFAAYRQFTRRYQCPCGDMRGWYPCRSRPKLVSISTLTSYPVPGRNRGQCWGSAVQFHESKRFCTHHAS